jgi:hypothetical protein
MTTIYLDLLPIFIVIANKTEKKDHSKLTLLCLAETERVKVVSRGREGQIFI